MTPGIVIEAPNPNIAAIKSTILTTLDAIDERKEQLKKAKEMITDSLEGIDQYNKIKDVQKDNAKKLSQIKYEVENKNPKIVEKIEDLKDELKELHDGLSDYLAEFVRMTGKMELRRNDGREVKIVRKFKVSPGQQTMF